MTPGPGLFDERRRRMPARQVARLDEAQATLAVLREEEARCERLGFELPLARVRDRIRYWTFVRGLVALAPPNAPGGTPCPDAPR